VPVPVPDLLSLSGTASLDRISRPTATPTESIDVGTARG